MGCCYCNIYVSHIEKTYCRRKTLVYEAKKAVGDLSFTRRLWEMYNKSPFFRMQQVSPYLADSSINVRAQIDLILGTEAFEDITYYIRKEKPFSPQKAKLGGFFYSLKLS